MKAKFILSIFVILVAVTASVGGTLAWFTDTATIQPNVFTAGSIEIEAGETWEEGYEVTNWNPGDCEDKEVWVEITGTKRAYLRMQFDDRWLAYSDTLAAWAPWTPDDPADVDPIKISLNGDVFPADVDHWMKVGDWYYYLGVGDPTTNNRIDVISEVCLDGPLAGNQFQGKRYELGFNFEAIQVTHEAIFTEAGWQVGYINYNSNGTTVHGWYEVNLVDEVWTMTVGNNTFVWTDPGYDSNGVPRASHEGWSL